MKAENVLVPSMINYLTLYVKINMQGKYSDTFKQKSLKETFLGNYMSEQYVLR